MQFSGKILWRFASGGPIRQQPRVTDDSVYVAAERAGLYRLERSTGNTLRPACSAFATEGLSGRNPTITLHPDSRRLFDCAKP